MREVRAALTELEKKVAGFVETNGLFDSAERVLLAVSGGADSIALLHIVQRLKMSGVLDAELLCAHINHQLRGIDSDLDEDFAVKQAEKLNLPIVTSRVDVQLYAGEHKMSIETAARELRIEGLLDIARDAKCRWIATGHHKNDNAETIIQRLTRGTGFRGLAGIWPRGVFGEFTFARPLLCVTREEIVNYLKQNNLTWREDRTNADCSYRRNYIRHRLLPALQQDSTESIAEQLSALARAAYRLHRQVQESAEKVWVQQAGSSDERVEIETASFRAQPELVKVEIVRRCLLAVGCGEKNLTQRHYERILQLAEQSANGRNLELPGRNVIRLEGGKLVFSKEVCSRHTAEWVGETADVKVPGQTKFGRYLIEATVLQVGENGLEGLRGKARSFSKGTARIGKSTEQFDFDKIRLPITVRYRTAGDRFWPLGMRGQKKVGKFLTAARLPREFREKVLVIGDSEKIIWVYPVRMSEQAKVTEKTARILNLHVREVREGQTGKCSLQVSARR